MDDSNEKINSFSISECTPAKKRKIIDVFGESTTKPEKINWESKSIDSIEDEFSTDHSVVMTRDLLEEMIECWLEKHAVEVLRDVLAPKKGKSFFAKK